MSESTPSTPNRGIHPGVQLFVLSFAALFLELMLIRWVPAVVRMVAYYANLMLISSFLGLGVGALVARRGWKLFRWFPLLLVGNIALLLACGDRLVAAATGAEARFFAAEEPGSALKNYIILVAVFAANTILFVPLGERVGELFHRLPPLRAYSWDLGGSLAGTVFFGIFSLFYFSPVIGMAGVMVIYLMLVEGTTRRWGMILLPLALAGVVFATDRRAVWSPYHYITIQQLSGTDEAVTEPPPDLHTTFNPPIYSVRIGRDFYHHHGTLDLSRYPFTEGREWLQRLHDQYMLPYHLTRDPKRVVVMGAGGGMDVEAALLAGAQHVDAVEIDPVLIDLSKRFNASGVYLDPRVQVHVDDARAHLRRMPGGYDLIVFGYLDSQSLFSSMTNLRMDSYIYTVESIQSAWEKLSDDGGVMALSFAVPNDWLPHKLVEMVQIASGQQPLVYVTPGSISICAIKGSPRVSEPPQTIGHFARLTGEFGGYDIPTDDWPYLYLARRMIPGDYLTVILSLIAFSVIFVAAVRGTSIGSSDGHFFFLGLGFLLLQTKSITDCSLYFGTTWLVSNIVIAGVLLMVLAANLVAMRLKRASRWYYVPLLASLLVLYFTPRDLILAQPFAGRLAWSLLVVPLPIFFAGLIFSTTFRQTANPSVSFGTNLIGATVGGFAEYLGMAIGSNALAVLVMGAYIASWLCRTLGGRWRSGENEAIPLPTQTGYIAATPQRSLNPDHSQS